MLLVFIALAGLFVGALLLFMQTHMTTSADTAKLIVSLKAQLAEKDQQLLESAQIINSGGEGNERFRTLSSLLRACNEKLAKQTKQQSSVVVPSSSKFSGVEINQFCTDKLSNEKEWFKVRKRWNKKLDIRAGQKGEWPFITYYPPFWFCDKFPRYNEPRQETKAKPEDLAVVIFTGERLRYGRVMSIKSTWGSLLPKLMVFAAEEDTQLGITGGKHTLYFWGLPFCFECE